MYKMGLIGQGISKSRSKEVYEAILGEVVDYKLFDIGDLTGVKLVDFFGSVDFISITNPYKKSFSKQIDIFECDLNGEVIVNCIKLVNSKVIGTNTDYLAVKDILSDYGPNRVVILGDGAMSRVLEIVCNKLKISYKVHSRKLLNLDLDFASLDKNTLIVNTCSRDYTLNIKTKSKASFWDLNYNNKINDTLAAKYFHQSFDGMNLLVKQAEYALRFWEIQVSS